MENTSVIKLLTDIAISIIISGLMAVFMNYLKQPLIIGYIISGIIIGPGIGFGWVNDATNIETISEIGLIFLLFIIGLEINLRDFINSSKKILILSFSQVFGGTILLFIILRFILRDLSILQTIYISFCLNITSTLIVVKILKDKFETQTIAGKFTIGILIMQDLFAIIFLSFQKNFLNPQISLLLKSYFYTIGLLFVSYNFQRFILSKIIHYYSNSTELVILIAISYCFLVSMVADILGVSKDMGALIAGVSIANSPYTEEIVARISSIRDFFVTLFFVSLGLKLPSISYNILLLSLFLLLVSSIVRFFTVVIYHRILETGIRPLFITSINLFPISEFSLVITSLGLKYMHILEDTVILVLITMIVSSIISPYLINYNNSIFMFFSRIFGFENKNDDFYTKSEQADVLILGYNMIAREVILNLKKKMESLKIVVADFNAENKKVIKGLGGEWIYTDFSVYDSLKRLDKLKPRIIILPLIRVFLKETTPEKLALSLKSIFPYSFIIFVCESDSDEEGFLRLGVKVVNISLLTSSKIVRDVVGLIKK
jgi:Kef-type K+ transport system membrane component KefB